MLAACLLLFFVPNISFRGKLPSYTADVCFSADLSKLFCFSSTFNSTDTSISPAPQDCIESGNEGFQIYNQHLNVSIVFISALYFAENAVLMTCIYLLRRIQKDFNIINELMVVLVNWFLMGYISQGLIIMIGSNNNTHNGGKDSEMIFYSSLVLIVRSLISIGANSVVPIYQTLYGQQYYPIPPSIDGLDRLDVILHIPIACDAFYYYLEELRDEVSTILFCLYADLRNYDRACMEESNDEKYKQANLIYESYLADNA